MNSENNKKNQISEGIKDKIDQLLDKEKPMAIIQPHDPYQIPVNYNLTEYIEPLQERVKQYQQDTRISDIVNDCPQQ